MKQNSPAFVWVTIQLGINMKPICALIALLVGSASLVSAELKNPASPEGLESAKKDVERFRLALKKKTSVQLVKAFIPNGRKSYGGYEYYYNYMANIAIREELARRGADAETALRENIENKTRVWEAINGRGDTVGRICTKLLEKLAE
jgi:hypothetical protein